MITAEELRRGNLIQVLDSDTGKYDILRVTKIDLDFAEGLPLNTKLDDNSDHDFFKLKITKPVPLSKDILKGLGFSYYKYAYRLYKGQHRITVRYNNGWHLIYKSERGSASLLCDRSTHKFQNLIFELTGIELKLEQ